MKAIAFVIAAIPTAILVAAHGGEPPAAAPAASATPTATPAPPPADTAQPAPAPAATTQGEAVWYDSNARGSCSYTITRADPVISAPPGIYKKIEGCGMCLEVKGPEGTEVVRVVDQCHTCADNLLVINKPAFEKVAGRAVGRTPVSWRMVPCAVTGNLAFRFKESSSQYWTAIQIRNHKLPIKKVEFKRDGAWAEMTRSNDNYFAAAKGVGTGPVTLRITATDGQAIEETIQSWKDGKTYDGAAQFK